MTNNSNSKLNAAHNKIVEWLELIESSTKASAKEADAFQHPIAKGDIREFAIRHFLDRFLPESVGVGTGMAMNSEGAMSKQLDIVIADPTYPVLRSSSGSNIYLAESIIASIEVKSKLDKTSLALALDNQISLLNIGTLVSNAALALEQARVEWYEPDGEIVRRKVGRQMTPRTYIMGFSGFENTQTLNKSILDWMNNNAIDGKFPMLPKFITTDKIIGVNTALMPMYVPDQSTSAPNGGHAIFGCFPLQRQFALIACDILEAIAIREKAKAYMPPLLTNHEIYFNSTKIFNYYMQGLQGHMISI